MPGELHRDYKPLVKAAVAAGWTWHPKRKQAHPKLTMPGRKPVSIPMTPSDRRAYLNVRARLRREGVDV